MKRIVVALVAAIAGMPLAAQERPIFRSSANAVLVDVTVTDGRSSVANLKPADFDLHDNGVAQTVTDLDYGRLPIDVRLIFDISGSVKDRQLAAFMKAANQVGEALKDGDRGEVWSFGRHTLEVRKLGPPPIDAHITRTLGDGTSFFDGISLALITTARPGRRQLTIVLTDGFDTSSFFDQSALIRVAQRSDAVIDAIAPPTESLSSGLVVMPSLPASSAGQPMTMRMAPGTSVTMSATKVLDALVKPTGGRVLTLPSNGDVSSSFLKAIDEFRQSYVLHFVPTGVTPAGWHALTVAVKGKKNYIIRAKQGYEGT